MLSWLDNIFPANVSSSSPPKLDPALLALFRQTLGELEAAYRLAAQVCIEQCPEKLGMDPQRFAGSMSDLQRGLALKVFFEVARADGRWSPQERNMAEELLMHVWGSQLDRAGLQAAIEHITAHAETLSWESLLRPFVAIPLLREQAVHRRSI